MQASSLPIDNQYYWSVQTIDDSYIGSVFSIETTVYNSVLIEILTSNMMDFGSVYVGTQSPVQEIILRNNGTNNLLVNACDIISVDSPFHLVNAIFPSELTPQTTLSIFLIFEPQYSGTINDSLLISNNSTNIPALLIKVKGTGIYVPPSPPTNVVVANINYDMQISWDAVTTSVLGTPMTPDGYIVLYSELSNDNDSTFYFLWETGQTTLTHPMVANFRTHMFYRVIAYKLQSREQEEFLAELKRDKVKISLAQLLKKL